ncbi:MAG: ATP-binding protein, partial [Erysipelotrichaceae bacterium]|nr:ATP-binding protein [Erysipelotrichaceae bacterium]
KITFDIKNDLTAQQKKLAEKLFKDPRVQQLLKHCGADEKAVYDNAYIIDQWLQSLDGQADSYGNVDIKNSTDSYYRDLVIEEGEARIVLRKTSRQKEEDRQHGFRDNYLICDLSAEMLDYDIDRISEEGESENYLKVVSIVKRWLQQLPDKGLYLWGGLGVGKTYLAAAMTKHMAKKGSKVAFVNVPAFFSQARNSVGSQEYGQASFVENALRKMKRADFLVLDDIGAETVTNWVRDDILLPVLDYRMENRKSTIFTINSYFADLRERLMYNQRGQKDEMKADRIMERIRTLCVEIKVEGTSRRK